MITIPSTILGNVLNKLENHTGVARKRPVSFLLDILNYNESLPLGDDCGIVPSGDGHLLFTADAIKDWLFEDPYYAGFCGINVVVNDIYAMGGLPWAVTNVIHMGEDDHEWLRAIAEGLRDACKLFGLSMSGGHLDPDAGFRALSVSGIGRANRAISTFGARAGDCIIAVYDLTGARRESFPIWDSSTGADPEMLRKKYRAMVEIAEKGLATACRDISNAGIIGTLAMMMETSKTSATVNLAAIPRPRPVPLEEWLFIYPSYGFILAVSPPQAAAAVELFHRRGLAAAEVGKVIEGRGVLLQWQGEQAQVYAEGIIFET